MLNSNDLKILSEDISKMFNVKIQYVLLCCTNCGSHWGVSMNNHSNMILEPKDLICRDCASKIKIMNTNSIEEKEK